MLFKQSDICRHCGKGLDPFRHELHGSFSRSPRLYSNADSTFSNTIWINGLASVEFEFFNNRIIILQRLRIFRSQKTIRHQNMRLDWVCSVLSSQNTRLEDCCNNPEQSHYDKFLTPMGHDREFIAIGWLYQPSEGNLKENKLTSFYSRYYVRSERDWIVVFLWYSIQTSFINNYPRLSNGNTFRSDISPY